MYSHDTILHFKEKMMKILYNCLLNKLEQERTLLIILVNKLVKNL